ncbi:hypothetical protein HYN59_17525 [Flavobacterium album]|uniref:DUF4422 domain-containing protein n=1 Tax=Flavobacterium album TaxID=2175091 RepID=A0A2S1R2P3_9FLAO|nr:DUF4422 domain-containing protein [Flavobacterium album]AWH86801.1 hypothetical protein HYN59_17525 [Flavobacterium album]
MRTKIFVVTHKGKPPVINEVFIPIQVGKGETIYDGIARDNTGDNITQKNSSFCELTASYWIDKNITDANYVGICHYRRYFNFFPPLFTFKPSRQKKATEQEFKASPTGKASAEKTAKKVAAIMKDHDCIMLRPYHMKEGLSESYYNAQGGHRESDWKETMKIIRELYPEYDQSIVDYLDNGHNFHMGNMMVTTKEKWAAYHKWLFSILFELEKRIEVPTDAVQGRVFGYISERIINLYVYHNKFRIKEMGGYKITDL